MGFRCTIRTPCTALKRGNLQTSRTIQTTHRTDTDPCGALYQHRNQPNHHDFTIPRTDRRTNHTFRLAGNGERRSLGTAYFARTGSVDTTICGPGIALLDRERLSIAASLFWQDGPVVLPNECEKWTLSRRLQLLQSIENLGCGDTQVQHSQQRQIARGGQNGCRTPKQNVLYRDQRSSTQ